MSSTPVREAASISRTSTWRSSAMVRQGSHTPHGATVGPPLPSAPTQFKARARMRAVVVLPTPRTPVRMKACAIRPVAIAFDRVRTIASCPISSAKVEGRYLRARTRYAAAESLILENHVETRETGRTTQIGARYGCFLPDLTGLARDLSVAGLPWHYMSCRRCEGKHRMRGEGLRPTQWRIK